MRGIAALFVALYHSYYWLPHFINAYTMVDLFFIISGFIIARTYLQPIAAGDLSFRQYAVRRLARIYPMHLFSLLVVMIIYGAGGYRAHSADIAPVYHVVMNLLLLNNVGLTPERLQPQWNVPAWSLSAEWIVSLLFFIVIQRRKQPSLFALLTTIFVGVALLQHTTGSYTLNWGLDGFFILNYGLLRGIIGFSIGMVIYHFQRDLPQIATKVFLIVEGMLWALFLWYAVVPSPHYLFGIDYIMLLIVFPLLLITCLYKQSLARRILELPPFQFLGNMSYSIYMIHFPAILVFNTLRDAGMKESLVGSCYIAAVLVLAYVCNTFVENPARVYIKRRFANGMTDSVS